MLKRLRWKIVLVIMLLAAAALGAALVVQTASAARQYREETERVLRSVLDRGEALIDPMRPFAPGQDEELYTTIPAFFAVVDGSGRAVLALSYNALVDEAAVARAVEGALTAGAEAGRLDELGLRFQLRTKGGWIQAAFADQSWERGAVGRQAAASALVFGAALAGFFLVSLALSRWLVLPVEESWRRQRQFVADASHELKTPLTVLLADADILLDRQEDTIASQRQWVEHIREEGLRMKGLVGDLLFLAQEDAARRPRAQGRADLSALCRDCVMSFEPVAYEAGLALESDVAAGVSVPGGEEELRRLCAILLDNACKYCPPGGAVTVTLSAGDRAVLTVHNTGDPIPAEALPHLFERFYRADAARNRAQGGYGLGLSIAAAIAEGRRGRITVRSEEGRGTAFTVTLPLE